MPEDDASKLVARMQRSWQRAKHENKYADFFLCIIDFAKEADHFDNSNVFFCLSFCNHQ